MNMIDHMLNIIHLLLGFMACTTLTEMTRDLHEFCQADVFRAKCWRNEVILMTHALYGRMKMGKCVVADLGYIGCSTDVRHLLDAACSGRNQCDYPVPTPDLEKTQPCFQELKTYLEASYQCIKVAMAEKSVCTSSPYLKLVSSQGYLSSYVAGTYGCGTLTSPWRVTVFPGQRVNISLIDFTQKHGTAQRQLGYIMDLLSGQTFTINTSPSEKEIFLFSYSSSVDIKLITDRRNEGEFLVKFEVYGCHDLIAPEFAWYTREEDVAVVGCEHSDSTWHLRCEGNNWRGVIGNCSGPASTVVIIISTALGIALCVLAAGVICALRHQKNKQNFLPVEQHDSKLQQTYIQQRSMSCQKQSPCPNASKYFSAECTSVRHDYTDVWDEDRVTTGDSDYGSQSYYSSRPQHHKTSWDILNENF